MSETATQTFEAFAYDSLDRPSRMEFNELFKAKFNYEASSTVSRLFREGRSTINHNAFFRRFLTEKEFLTDLQAHYHG